MLLHQPGKLQRLTDLSKGFDVNLGQALGHKASKKPADIGSVEKLFKSEGLDFRLRPNQMGFAGKSYTAKTRPMDIFTRSAKLSILPSGACTIKQVKHGPLGFNTEAKGRVAPSPASRQLVPAVSRRMQRTAGNGPRNQGRARITSRTTFAPTAKTSFSPTWGGRTLRTR